MQNSSDPYLAQHSKSGRQFKIGVNIITEQERIAKVIHTYTSVCIYRT